jgi:hypothetical protein
LEAVDRGAHIEKIEVILSLENLIKKTGDFLVKIPEVFIEN